MLVKNVTCPVCGSFCDDLELMLKNGKIKEVKNACAVGESKFLAHNGQRILKPLIRKNGKLVESSLDEAIDVSAKLLTQASYPILYGWSNTSCEAIRVGIELAEEVGGVIDNTSTVCHGPSVLGMQDIGISSCTLGQLRHRADLVVYWGCNPWSAHPRHLERYTTFSEGRFEKSTWRQHTSKLRSRLLERRVKRITTLTEEERKEKNEVKKIPYTLQRSDQRKLIVVDVRMTNTAKAADFFLQVEPNMDFELLNALRVIINGGEIDLDEVNGIKNTILEELAEVLIECNLGILFFGLGLTMSRGKIRNIDAALSLVKDLNKFTKFLIMPMRGHFNVTGADIVSTWQTGYPFAVDLSHGYPYYNPGETSVVDILSRDESDAALIIASDPVSNFPNKSVTNLIKKPIIVIDPNRTPTSIVADVVIPSSFVGIETGGTAYRMDHVPLPLKSIIPPPKGILSDKEILLKILKKVRIIKGEK